MKNYHRFNNHMTPLDAWAAFWRKMQGKDPRFAKQPAWLKAEMLDKAAAKRAMRAKKKL